jgi:putative cofactor-binding repeat protein
MNKESQKDSGSSLLMSARDFASWGLQDIAFIKQVTVDGTAGWGIFAADGSSIGMAPDRDVAFAAVRQHDLEPVSVH